MSKTKKDQDDYYAGREARRKSLAPEPWRSPMWWRGYTDADAGRLDY